MAEREELVNEILRRHEALKKEREEHEDIWEDITEIVLPRVSDIIDKTAGQHTWTKRIADNYSAVGRNAVRLWSNGMQGYMTPRNSPWVNITISQKRIREQKMVRQYLQDMTEALLAHWRRSNFYDALGPVFEHGAAVATSGLTVDWDPTKSCVYYIPRHPKQIWIAENIYGKVDTVYTVEDLTWRQIVQQFGEEVLEEHDRKTAERSPFEVKQVLHAVQPRSERMQNNPRAENKPVASIWILLGSNTLLKESGYDKMRDIVWRFRRGPGTPYGTGPSHDALIDLLRAEKINATMLRAADLSVLPPLQYPQELKGKLNISPHGMTPYMDPSRRVEPIFTVGQYPYGVDIMERLERAIKDHYHIDFWLMLSQSQGAKTAYEVAQLAGEKAAVMGSEIGRTESELLDPLIDVTIHLLGQNGMLPEPPEILRDMPEDAFDYSYDGPLAQMQKRHYGQQNIIQMLSQVTLVGQVFPESLDWINDDELMQAALDGLDAPENVIRDKRDVQERREARAQAQQQQAQMEQMQVMADVQQKLKGVNPAGMGMGM